MKKVTLFSTAAILALASIGCSTATNTNTTTVGRTNANTATVNSSNTAVVVNTNNMETGAMNSNSMNANITRADYDRDKDRYAQEAKQAGRTIGSGVDDGWIWTKTRAALLTTNDLRESTVNVDVSNNVVTLTGTVGTAAQKSQAETVAKGIEGVKSVTNNLKVQPNDSITNQAVGTNATSNTANANRR